MKIALVSRFPRDIDKPRGGVETATVGLARALQARQECEVHVVTLEQGLSSPTSECHEGIGVHRLPRSRWPMIVDVFAGPSTRLLREFLATLSPDVVHFQETWGFSAPHCGLPALFTVHGFDSLNLPTERQGNWRLRALLWRWAEARGMREQRFVVSIAPYVRKEIERLTSARIFDIWNALDRRYFELPRQEKKGNILFLGWLNPRKNPAVLIDVADRLRDEFPDARFLLAGEAADQDYAETLRRKIADLGLAGQVSLPGRLSQTEVIEQICCASMLVLPSLQENAPMVIAEAMAARLPVLASNLCGIPDMIDDGVSGYLIEPHDIEGIAGRVAGLLRDDALRRQIGEAAHVEAVKRYHPESVAEATVAVYRQAIATWKG